MTYQDWVTDHTTDGGKADEEYQMGVDAVFSTLRMALALGIPLRDVLEALVSADVPFPEFKDERQQSLYCALFDGLGMVYLSLEK